MRGLETIHAQTSIPDLRAKLATQAAIDKFGVRGSEAAVLAATAALAAADPAASAAARTEIVLSARVQMAKVKYYDEVVFDDVTDERMVLPGLLNKLILPLVQGKLEGINNGSVNGTMTAEEECLLSQECTEGKQGSRKQNSREIHSRT